MVMRLFVFLICLTALVWQPSPANAQVMDGLFGGKSSYKISLKILRCQPEGEIPYDLPNMPEPAKHPACGVFNAVTLVDTTFTLQPGQKKAWQKTQPVAVSEQVYKAELEDGVFVLKRDTITHKELKSGYEMEVYLSDADKREARISLWVRHFTIDSEGEEMLLHSDGDVYLNPHARQTQRLSTFTSKLEVGETDILGGESILRAPAGGEVPQIYPEEARLWAEVTLQK